jgi:fructokinase
MICTDKGSRLADGQNFLKKAGGAPANVAAAIAALGGQVDMAAKVGKDPFGQHLIDLMSEMGVNTKWVIQDPNTFTTFAFVSLMEDGERDFYFNRGADGQLSMTDLTGLNLKEYDIVHFGSATGFLPGPLQATYIDLLNKAKEAGALISFDPNYRHLLFPDNTESFINQSWHYIAACDFFKLSDEEAILITGLDTVDAAAAALRTKTNAVFAITLGKEGTLLSTSNGSEIISSIPITAVDATGAGDAFVGAVLYQLLGTTPNTLPTLPIESWRIMIANANKAGARTCEYMGAMEAFKHLNNSIFNS